MIKTLIADDEAHAIDRLKDLLAEHEQFEIVAVARDGSEALEQMVALKPDVAFLDINMPGVSVFKTISSLQDPPLIVFQTAHSKYAADAFDVDALDYLMKPVSRERFSRAVDKVIKNLVAEAPITAEERPAETDNRPVPPSQSEKISVKVQGAIRIIKIAEIRKVCFEEGLSFIYTREGRFMSDRSLNYYEEKFQGHGFFRSNRANLVNLTFVAAIHKGFKGAYTIKLQDGSIVELSRRKALTLKKTLDF